MKQNGGEANLSDGIHSTARGRKAIAQHVANAIRQMYGDSIFQPGY
ncbi:MAG: hypothetical protein ACF8AM_09810 [Rhodopirellula sp. JB055]